jgi:hypothetical protein
LHSCTRHSNQGIYHSIFTSSFRTLTARSEIQRFFKDFAKKVYEKSTLNGKPAIVITVPLWITQVIEGFNAPDRFNYDIGQADIFDNTGLLANRELIFTDSKDIPYIIQSTYKQIKKPYVRF